MSFDDYNHSVVRKVNLRKKSMDLEFHDHIESNTDPSTVILDESSSHRPAHEYGGDSDDSDDSFYAASYDCEPDHDFLAEMLQDEHPKRLNLLERDAPSPKANSLSPQEPESAHKVENAGGVNAENEIEAHEKAESVRLYSGAIDNCSPEEDTEEEADLISIPTPLSLQSKAHLKNSEAMMRKSTEESFRGVSNGFFSKPFKDLAQKVRRPGSNKG